MKKIIIFTIFLAIFLLTYFLFFFQERDNERLSIIETSSPTQKISLTLSPTPTVSSNSNELLVRGVPFAAQAPFNNWTDDRFQDGCEEASVIMAIRWVKGQGLTAQQMNDEIITISAFEKTAYGNYHDTSAKDTAARIINGYYGYKKYEVKYNINKSDIILELEKGNVVITPMDGRMLGNPNYTAPGPERHMIVIIGYNRSNDQFTTNDPGTRSGKNYRYEADHFVSAIRDYPSGYHEPIIQIRKAMISVSK